MNAIEMTRRGFAKGAAMGAVCAAAMGAVGSAGAEEDAEPRVDTYTHATEAILPNYKQTLAGEDYENAIKYLSDSSHYLYVDRAMPSHGDYTNFPVLGFDTDWRSPVNGRVYRGPYADPITRSVIWLTTNPNGSINTSVGSYWAMIPPNTELELNNNELQGYEPSDNWQLVCCLKKGQTAENYIREGRGSVMVDAPLLGHYGLTEGWTYGVTEGSQSRNVLDVEVKVRSYVRRVVTPQQYYDGMLPSTTMWMVTPLVVEAARLEQGVRRQPVQDRSAVLGLCNGRCRRAEPHHRRGACGLHRARQCRRGRVRASDRRGGRHLLRHHADR